MRGSGSGDLAAGSLRITLRLEGRGPSSFLPAPWNEGCRLSTKPLALALPRLTASAERDW